MLFLCTSVCVYVYKIWECQMIFSDLNIQLLISIIFWYYVVFQVYLLYKFVIPSVGFQQTSHLSSYEIITPWRLTRERREARRPYSKQVSYLLRNTYVFKFIFFINKFTFFKSKTKVLFSVVIISVSNVGQ